MKLTYTLFKPPSIYTHIGKLAVAVTAVGVAEVAAEALKQAATSAVHGEQVCIRIICIGVVSVVSQYNCVYYCETGCYKCCARGAGM
jgi:hypothetical protein